MKKNIVLLLLTVLVVQFCICSCTYYTDDPFLTDSNNTDEITGEVTSENTQDQQEDYLIHLPYTFPDDDFYGLSVSEAVDKYGILNFIYNDTATEDGFDGKYTYSITQMITDDPSSWTLYKKEYPNGKTLSPVCTDPLCTHTVRSGCPLANLAHSKIICHGDKIFISTSSGTLYMYDKKTNKSTSILSNCYSGVLLKHNGVLYFYYSELNQDFDTERIITKISEDGEVTEIKRMKEYYSMNPFVYNDSCLIDCKSEVFEDGSGKITIYSRDVQTDVVKTITETECPGAVQFATVEPRLIYGSKLLIYYRYYTNIPSYSSNDERQAVWLIDLQAKEKRLLFTPDIYTYKRFTSCLYSSKCVIWPEVRVTESDPIIIHVYFPYEDRELTYNISDMIKAATGDENLSFSIEMLGNSNSAIYFFDMSQLTPTRVYEVDLENGNVYKYDVPAA